MNNHLGGNAIAAVAIEYHHWRDAFVVCLFIVFFPQSTLGWIKATVCVSWANWGFAYKLTRLPEWIGDLRSCNMQHWLPLDDVVHDKTYLRLSDRGALTSNDNSSRTEVTVLVTCTHMLMVWTWLTSPPFLFWLPVFVQMTLKQHKQQNN